MANYCRAVIKSPRGTVPRFVTTSLKGHGNEADFLGVLQKLGPHSFLTLPFEPFRFWLRIRGDIHNRKRLPESATLRLGESGSH